MEECRLGYDALHVIQSPPEDISPDYVVVQYTCSCGEIISQFALHHIILRFLMGTMGPVQIDPRMRPYFHMLITLQADAILAARSAMNQDEESPDR